MHQVATADGSGGTSTVIDTTGVTELKVDVGRGAATIRFGDVSEAAMRTTGGGDGEWTMRRDGDELRVERPSAPFGWWIAGWFGMDQEMADAPPRARGELEADLDRRRCAGRAGALRHH